jgi:hypothetical protein
MSEEQQNEGAGDGSENGQQVGAEQEGGGQQEGQEQGGTEQLGDAGKKALDAMKAERKAALAVERATVNALAELHDKTPAEIRAAIKGGTLAEVIGKPAVAAADGQQQPDVNKLVAQAKREALADANLRILRAEVRAAAAGKLADPADALTMLDLTKFEVGDNGEVDPGELADAIGELVSRKPYLAANATTTTFGKSDGGVRGGGKAPSLDEQISTAEKAGDYNTARQLKVAKLAASTK